MGRDAFHMAASYGCKDSREEPRGCDPLHDQYCPGAEGGFFFSWESGGLRNVFDQLYILVVCEF